MVSENFGSYRPKEGSPEAIEWQKQEEALLQHAELLDKLHKNGIAQLIEEEAGKRLPRLRVQSDENQPPRPNLMGVMHAAGQTREGEWGYDLVPNRQKVDLIVRICKLELYDLIRENG